MPSASEGETIRVKIKTTKLESARGMMSDNRLRIEAADIVFRLQLLGMTLKQIAQRLGLTNSRLSQLSLCGRARFVRATRYKHAPSWGPNLLDGITIEDRGDSDPNYEAVVVIKCEDKEALIARLKQNRREAAEAQIEQIRQSMEPLAESRP